MQNTISFSSLIIVVILAGCTQSGPEPETSAIAIDLSFSEITESAGLTDFNHNTGASGKKWFPETMGSGVAFVDVNGDDWQDILLVGGGDLEQNDDYVRKLWIYLNNQRGSFDLNSDLLEADAIDGYGFGVSAADYDNDGDVDIFLTSLGRNQLFRNDGDTFTDVGASAGVTGGESDWSTSSIFFDANNDGWLDLYVGNYVEWTTTTDLLCSLDGVEKAYCTPQLYKGTAGRFYLSNRDGTFADVTEQNGFPVDGGKNLGVAALDFNRDGLTDLMVANDTDPDQLFENIGDGKFQEIGMTAGIAFDERGRARAGMGIDTGVVDSTGEETVFVGNFSNQMIGVYRHVNNSVFVDRAATSQVGRGSLLTLTFGLFLFDADLDADLDLFAVNGHVQPSIETIKDNVSYRQPSHLFLNDGSGLFTDIAGRDGVVLLDSLVGRGAAYADFDKDGDLDILVSENGGGARLFRNDLQERTYLRVRLVGSTSNRNGIGARIAVYSNGYPQYRNVRTGSSFLSQSELPVTFGFGDSQSVDSVVVHWPSGTMSRRSDIQINSEIVIEEPGE